jgi:hypothetical protein
MFLDVSRFFPKVALWAALPQESDLFVSTLCAFSLGSLFSNFQLSLSVPAVGSSGQNSLFIW